MKRLKKHEAKLVKFIIVLTLMYSSGLSDIYFNASTGLSDIYCNASTDLTDIYFNARTGLFDIYGNANTGLSDIYFNASTGLGDIYGNATVSEQKFLNTPSKFHKFPCSTTFCRMPMV